MLFYFCVLFYGLEELKIRSYLCRLPSAVNVMLNLSNISLLSAGLFSQTAKSMGRVYSCFENGCTTKFKQTPQCRLTVIVYVTLFRFTEYTVFQQEGKGCKYTFCAVILHAVTPCSLIARQRGVAEWFRVLDLKSGGPWFKSSTLLLSTGFVLGFSPEFNFSRCENSQLVSLPSVGILNSLCSIWSI